MEDEATNLIKKGDYDKLAEVSGYTKPDEETVEKAKEEFKEVIEKGATPEDPAEIIMGNIKFEMAKEGKLDEIMPKQKRSIYIRKISNTQQTSKKLGLHNIVAISLQGKILIEAGFSTGDIIRLTPSKNQLLIEKIEPEKTGDWIEIKAEENNG